MPLDPERSRIWEALGIGPQWLERASPDPLLSEAPPPPAAAPAARAAAVPARPAASGASQSQPYAPQPQPRAGIPASPVSATRIARPAVGASRPAPRAVVARPVQVVRAEQPVITADAQKIFEGIETASWAELAERLPHCEACGLSKSRIRTVFADGEPGCPIVMVGEAPGAEEDLQGKPFVGKSGQLLSAALASVGIVRGKDAAIINVLKCRPPGNRDPMPEEVTVCRHFLDRQLELLAPKLLVLMGRPAARTILGVDETIGRLRGQTHRVEIGGRSVPVIVTYHPSYLLRQLSEKEKFWHDLVAVKRLLAAAEQPSA